MAKIVLDGQELEVKLHEPINEPCEQMGVAFGCQDGVCQVCRVDVLSGEEHLSELSPAEKEAGLDKKTRLCCQVRLVSEGTVVFKY